MSDREPLSLELTELIEAERRAPIANAAQRAAVRARLSVSVGGAPLGHVAAASGLAASTKVIAVFAIIVTVSGGIAALLYGRQQPPASDRVAEPAPATASASFSSVAAPAIESVPITAEHLDEPIHGSEPGAIGRLRSKAPVASTTQTQLPDPAPAKAASTDHAQSKAPPAAPVVSTTQPHFIEHAEASQLELLRRARHALTAADPKRALELVEDDERLHPTGLLVEEREALMVLAMAASHRVEAYELAVEFTRRYPNSVHGASVQRVVDSKENR